MDFLKTLLTPLSAAPFCLDVGANEGGYIWSILQARPRAVIHAFEPLDYFYRHTARRFVADLQVFVFPLGVSNVNAYVEGLAVHEAWTLSKLGENPHGRNAASLAREGPEPFPVLFTTIDHHLRQHASHRGPVEFLKIDTDGYELRVLQGAHETIMRDRPLILIELGYMVADIGDSIADFITYVYDTLDYVWIPQDGVPLSHAQAIAAYPHQTTWDVAMVPRERPLEIL